MSLGVTLRRYRRLRAFLASPLAVALAVLLVMIGLSEPGNVVVAVGIVCPIVFLIFGSHRRDPVYGGLLADIFLAAFVFRAVIGAAIYYFDLHLLFGGDATTYDYIGSELAEVWRGAPPSAYLVPMLNDPNRGIFYWAAGFYYIFGQNLLLLDFVSSAFGAATTILVVRIADRLFDDREVSIISAILVAFFPSMALWSAQLLKEPLLIFCLCLIVYSMQRVLVRLRLRYLVYIVVGLVATFFLRFYMFYIMLLAIAMSPVGPARRFSPIKLLRQLTVVGLVVVAIAYVVGSAELWDRLDQYASLEQIQVARDDQAFGLSATGERVGSGFAIEADISTREGALRQLPIGFLYFMFAPFPWETTGLRHAVTVPEGLLWWLMFPAFLRGLWLVLRHRLPESWIILVFTVGLTLVYALSQGNVGTAYRQRSQVLVFYFIFVALGYVWKKRRRLARALARVVRAAPLVGAQA